MGLRVFASPWRGRSWAPHPLSMPLLQAAGGRFLPSGPHLSLQSPCTRSSFVSARRGWGNAGVPAQPGASAVWCGPGETPRDVLPKYSPTCWQSLTSSDRQQRQGTGRMGLQPGLSSGAWAGGLRGYTGAGEHGERWHGPPTTEAQTAERETDRQRGR